jgi:hypothetical protein
MEKIYLNARDLSGLFSYFLKLYFDFFISINTSVDTEMCCPKGKCGCQYFILLTLKKKIRGHRGPGFF